MEQNCAKFILAIAGTMRYPTSPFRLKSSDWQTAAAPLLGEHNDEVFKGGLRLTESDQKLIDGRNIT